MPGLLSAAVASALISKSTVPTTFSSSPYSARCGTGDISPVDQQTSLIYGEYGSVTDYVSYIPPIYARAYVSYKSRTCTGALAYDYNDFVQIIMPGGVSYVAHIDNLYTPTYISSQSNYKSVALTTTGAISFSVGDYMFDPNPNPMENKIQVKLPQTDKNGRDTFYAVFGYATSVDASGLRVNGTFNIFYRLAITRLSVDNPYIVVLYYDGGVNKYKYAYKQLPTSNVATYYTSSSSLTISNIDLEIFNDFTVARRSVEIYGIYITRSQVTATGAEWTNSSNVIMGINFIGTPPSYDIPPLTYLPVVSNLKITPTGVYLL